MSETLAFTEYAVYRKTEHSGLALETIGHELDILQHRCRDLGVQLRGVYDVSEFSAEADVLVWTISSDPRALQLAGQAFRQSQMERSLERHWSAIGVHRQAEFNDAHVPAFMAGAAPKEWVTIYPFVRTPQWYLLAEEERRAMLQEHGEIGRQFPGVLANTVASFGIGDHEWLLAFEADEVIELVDMMRELRRSQARGYVARETPFFTGRRMNASEISMLLG